MKKKKDPTVQCLLEKEMATHSSVFAWKIPMDSRVWWAAVHSVTRAGHDLVTKPPPYTIRKQFKKE